MHSLVKNAAMLLLVRTKKDNIKWLQDMGCVRGQADRNNFIGIAKLDELHNTV
jgi:hypothetical protein